MSNPRRPRFGLSFYDDNDEPIENVLTSATRPCRQRNPQPLPPSSPETSSLPTPGNPPPVTSLTPLAPQAPTPMSSHTAELKAAPPMDFSGKNDDATHWICYGRGSTYRIFSFFSRQLYYAQPFLLQRLRSDSFSRLSRRSRRSDLDLQLYFIFWRTILPMILLFIVSSFFLDLSITS